MSYGLSHFAGSAGGHAGGRLPDPLWTPGGYTIFDRQGNFSPLVETPTANMGHVFDANGDLVARPNQLFNRSEDFENAAFVKTFSTIASAAVASPLGPTAGRKLLETATTGVHEFRSVAVELLAGVEYETHISAKESERRYLRVGFAGAWGVANNYAVIDTRTGAVTYQGNQNLVVETVPENDGWWRIYVRWRVVATATNTLYCGINYDGTTGTSAAGDTSAGIFLSGWNLNLGRRQPYRRTEGAPYFGSRVSHDPADLKVKALLARTSRTNSSANNTMQGVQAGVPGAAPTLWSVSNSGNGLTREILGVFLEKGRPYFRIKVSGKATTTAAFSILSVGTVGAVLGSTGQLWSNALECRVVAGATSGLHIAMQEFDTSGTFLRGPATQINPGAAVAKFIQPVTLGASTASIRAGCFISYSVNQEVNVTLDIGVPELSLGDIFLWEPPILTYGAPVTVNADFPVANVTGIVPAAGYTLYAHCDDAVAITGATRRYVQLDDGTASNRVLMGRSAPIVSRLLVQNNNAPAADLQATVPSGGRIKSAARVRTNDFRQATNNVLSPAGTSGSPPAVTWLRLGSDVGGEVTVLGTRIYNAGILPALPDSALNRLTRI